MTNDSSATEQRMLNSFEIAAVLRQHGFGGLLRVGGLVSTHLWRLLKSALPRQGTFRSPDASLRQTRFCCQFYANPSIFLQSTGVGYSTDVKRNIFVEYIPWIKGL